MSVPRTLPGVICRSACVRAQAALTMVPWGGGGVSWVVWWWRGGGGTYVVGEGQALVVGDAVDLLEDEGVGAADGAGGDEDLGGGGGDGAEEGDGGGKLHFGLWCLGL